MIASERKKALGQYFTREKVWLKSNVKEFILNSKCSIAYDPFAGSGELLNLASQLGLNLHGVDVDKKLKWEYNDSLINIPHIESAIIITNPPYLSNYSAKRKGLWREVEKYFKLTKYDNLYLLALEKMLEAQDFVVAIIPETFLNSPFPKRRLCSINILEENPFHDTENPVCVACFDAKHKSESEIRIYKNEHFATTLGEIEKKRLQPTNAVRIHFNRLSGQIALRAVDTTNPSKMIEFMRKRDLDYDLAGIKHSSRLITVIDINLKEEEIDAFIKTCNVLLTNFRKETDDILLSPFKGNMKNGVRRRRLDYKTARAIMEEAFKRLRNKNQTKTMPLTSFTKRPIEMSGKKDDLK